MYTYNTHNVFMQTYLSHTNPRYHLGGDGRHVTCFEVVPSERLARFDVDSLERPVYILGLEKV